MITSTTPTFSLSTQHNVLPANNSRPPTQARTQEKVPDIIRELYHSNIEVVQPSHGEPKLVANDPHLRLRRTLTPSLNRGIKKYNEAQFMIQGSSGKRIQLSFSVEELDGQERLDFTMDAYVWGASESKATHRMVAIHGISPGVSRTRWHSLGEKLTQANPGMRFVALDWHSIDRSTDQPQTSFLTLLPKHIFSAPSNEKLELFLSELPIGNARNAARKTVEMLRDECPRSTSEGSKVLRAVIVEGLGWGTAAKKKFILGIKSWSGSIGMQLVQDSKTDSELTGSIESMVAMHPACFSLCREECQSILQEVPDTLLCWAKDDTKAPFFMSKWFTNESGRVKLVTYTEGNHHNFDGTDGLPNFNDEVIDWFNERRA